MNYSITYDPIGIIYTPFNEIAGMPIQTSGAAEVEGKIILKAELTDGLKDLQGFSHLILLYHFHRISGFNLNVIPFMDDKSHGIFATRAPKRPNAIGLSIVELLDVNLETLLIKGVDMLNETPLLDIKPYYPKYDIRNTATSGWLAGKDHLDINKIRSDNRFNDNK
jgi:tRNA (adenine37-N6)-methyltransferase